MHVLLESPQHSNLRRAAAANLADIRTILYGQAVRANLADPERFAHNWHFLMKGCIVSANEGNLQAAKQAQAAGAILLQHWHRV